MMIPTAILPMVMTMGMKTADCTALSTEAWYMLVESFLKLPKIFLLAHEGLGGAHPLEGFGKRGGDEGVIFAGLPRAQKKLLLKPCANGDERRKDREHEQAEHRVQNDQYHRDHADETKGPHEVERSPGDDAGKFCPAVRSKARNQPAERAVIEVRKLQFLQAVKTVPA